MAKARTRTFRMRPLDEWALDTARHVQGERADFTAALQLLIDLGVRAGVEKGYWKPYQAPSVEDRLDPARLAAAKADAQDPEGDIEPQPRSEKENSNEKCNSASPASVTPGEGDPLATDADLEDPVPEVEEKPVGPVLFDDGPNLPEGWEPLEADEYNATCRSCGVSELRWVGPREPRGLRRLQDRAGTIHNPGACRRRQEAARS